MKLHDIAQRTPEWFALRRGKFTASEVGMFVVDPEKNAVAAKAWKKAIRDKLGDEADGDDTAPGYEDYWMKRGTRLEPKAIAAYEKFTGHHVDQFGFIEHPSGLFGCSPDGIVFDRSSGEPDYSRILHGLEMKCPKGSVQIQRLDEGVLPDEYACQVHASMAITGAARWDFWSWHPKLPPFRITVERDSFTEKMLAGLLAIGRAYEDQQAKLADLCDEHLSRVA